MMVQDPAVALDEIVVTGARLPPAAGEAAFSVIRLDPRVLDRALRLDEALASVPAVSLFRRTSSLAANPTTQGISLRAIAPSGAGRTLVTLDGVPLNDPFGGWVIWSQVAPKQIGGLDIVRGAGAGPYGAGALTGVIALRERDDGLDLDASVAERGGARLAAAGVRPGRRVSVSGAALYETNDGYTPVRGPAAGVADTPLDLETLSGSVRADIGLTAGASVSLRAGAYEETRGAGLAGAGSTASGSALSATAARAPTTERAGWRAQVWRRESDLNNSSVAVAADRASTTPANDQFATPAEGWGANLALRRRRGAFEGELGADARFTEGETQELFRFMTGAFTRERRAGGRTSVAGAYGDGSWRGGDWLIAGGARLDRWTSTGGFRRETDRATGAATLNAPSPDQSGEVFSARLAARRDLGAGLAARAAAYSGFRPATLNELHRPFRVGNDLTEANAALDPERLTGIETGLAHDSERTVWGLTVFANRIEDAIVNVTLGQGPGLFPRAGFVPAGGVLRERRNAGTIDAIGLEASAERRFDALTLTAAASVTDARLDGGTDAPQLTGLRPAQAPIWSVVGGVDWRASERLTLAASGRYESKRFDDDLNSRVLAAALTFDARADWRLTPTATLYGTIDNLFDAEVEVAETGTGVEGYGPPRTLRLGIRVSY